MLFTIVNGLPVPQPPPAADVTPPVADGQSLFDVDGVAETLGWPREALLVLYELTFPPVGGMSIADGAPASGPAPLSAAAAAQLFTDWRGDPVKVLLREEEFGWIKDPDFAVFLAKCHRRGVDPWGRQVFPQFQYNERSKRNELVLIASIELIRAKAHATGQYVGFGRIEYEYADDRKPLVAIASIKKLVAGRECVFTGEAHWSNYYPGGGTGTLWDDKPEVCLGICAERIGLARAFPQLAELYTPQEFTKSRRGPQGGGPDAGSGATVSGGGGGDPLAPAAVEPEPPDNQMGFHLALMELGLRTPMKREEVISFFRAKHPGLIEHDAQRFYGVVLRAVRSNPREWGAGTG